MFIGNLENFCCRFFLQGEYVVEKSGKVRVWSERGQVEGEDLSKV